ncbi:MAG: hypothetical protein HYY23_04195 [Verrucomicrobia bacterium]|nr:hypothetical protein [Verrucomicrobiota bacterium]
MTGMPWRGQRAVFAVLCFALQWTGRGSPGVPAATQPHAQREAGTNGPPPSGIILARSAQPAALAALNRLQALEWADQTRQTIAPTMHLVETEHFLILSAWNSSNDAALARICEEMFAKLRAQFNLSKTEPVWIGKCPIYIFWEPAHFLRFTKEVDRVSRSNAFASHADGYHATRGAFSHIVINGVREFGTSKAEATRRFYEVLVHEGTHAFMNRLISNRSVARWVEEGLADFMAATLVPMSDATRKHIEGARHGLRRSSLVERLFEKKELSAVDYGIAQSLVRYLIQTNPGAFIRFVELMKNGAAESEALAGAYGWSRTELIRNWTIYTQKTLGRQRS